MTTRAEIEALIKMLEEAREGSRELDLDVAIAVEHKASGGAPRWETVSAGVQQDGRAKFLSDSFGCVWQVPRFTRSVDAALTLVPADGFWEVGRIAADDSPMRHFGGGDTHRAVCGRWGGPAHQAYRSTPALALCIAALRARLSSMKDDANG